MTASATGLSLKEAASSPALPHRAAERLSRRSQLIDSATERLRGCTVYDYSHYAFRDIPVDSSAPPCPTQAHAVKDAVEQNGKVRFNFPASWDD